MKGIIIGLTALVLALGSYVAGLQDKVIPTFGSVGIGEQYQSTTTPAVPDETNLCRARVGTASSTTGILGSVNITTSGAGTLAIYDATTTNASLRAAIATTSMQLATFQASPTVGSYHFDVKFERGLLVDYTTTGTGVSSTTISYRCE
jgi:hypothetical protein